jgi:Na+/H+-dicarboxylate symporter
MRRKFWIISIANWCVAIAMTGIAAYLGIAHPTSMFVYAALFVVGIFAFVVAILAWVMARFGVEPEASAGAAPAAPAEEPAGEAEPAVPTGA